MNIEERKQADLRENEMWSRGFNFGVGFGVVVATVLICSVIGVVWFLNQ